jgi:hypothetical protein
MFPAGRRQQAEVRVKLISDLRLLTSVIDDFNDQLMSDELQMTK